MVDSTVTAQIAMQGKRVLLLGIPGVRKSLAAKNLATELLSLGHPFEVINFEEQYLWEFVVDDRASFLGEPLEVQHQHWLRAWAECHQRLEDGKNYLLTMHGCYLHKLFGARCVFDPGLVARQFAPALVLTLIADVYDAWSTTHGFANGQSIKGDPTLAQLLVARRMELLVGDQIALSTPVATLNGVRHQFGRPRHVRNLFLSVYHPLLTFVNAILSPDSMKVAYLSFPISQPREQEATGDMDARQSVSAFVAKAFGYQRHCHNLVVQCPLMIDELPFKIAMTKALNDDPDGTGPISFDRAAARWTIRELSPDEPLLVEPPEKLESFDREQVREAFELIKADVTLRDYRLVDQAHFLAVFNPIISPGRTRMARSVKEEIGRALHLKRKVFIFQDGRHDPENIVMQELGIDAANRATMESESAKDWLLPCPREIDLLTVIEQRGILR